MHPMILSVLNSVQKFKLSYHPTFCIFNKSVLKHTAKPRAEENKLILLHLVCLNDLLNLK